MFQNAAFFLPHDFDQESLELFGKTVEKSKAVSFLISLPSFPSKLETVVVEYKAAVEEKINKWLSATYGVEPSEIHFINKDPVAIEVIKEVIKNRYDVLVKEVVFNNDQKNYDSMAMTFLRKAPCEVMLLSQDDFAADEEPSIIIAIDAFAETAEGQDLNIQLLKKGLLLAHMYDASLEILSCWDFEYESFLRNSPFAKLPENAVDSMIIEKENDHEAKLDNIIKNAGLSPEDFMNVTVLRGNPKEIIPDYALSNAADLIVMGTVARTGIPGFIIGNTAETILGRLTTSIYAMKPRGFRSPIS